MSCFAINQSSTVQIPWKMHRPGQPRPRKVTRDKIKTRSLAKLFADVGGCSCMVIKSELEEDPLLKPTNYFEIYSAMLLPRCL